MLGSDLSLENNTYQYVIYNMSIIYNIYFHNNLYIQECIKPSIVYVHGVIMVI